MKVEYQEHMGSDLTVVNAARASFGKESEWRWSEDGTNVLHTKDARLIRFLATGYRASDWDELLLSFDDPDIDRGDLLRHFKNQAQHWAPFAHPHLSLRMTVPIFLARQLAKHCVTGDTEITFVKRLKGNSNGTRKVRIRDLYAMWTGQANKYQRGEKGKRNVRVGHVRVFDEATQRFSTSHIVDVLHQGTKPVFRVVTESGQSLRITGDHEVLTQRGWVRVDSLASTDYMVTESGSGELVAPAPIRWNDWADKQARRGVQKTQCARCGATENLEADHIVPVLLGGGHEPANMQCLCVTCHKKKSSTEKSLVNIANQFSPKYTAVVSVLPDGEEEVFDLTIDGTHNFMANGLVVHNCVGGTWSEESRRYISDEPDFYMPNVWHTRPEDVKQGSGEPVENQAFCDAVLQSVNRASMMAYQALLGAGVAPEEARMALPLNLMTTVVWTGSLLFWSRVYNQRIDPTAQLLAQQFAKHIGDIMQPLYPVSWAALT